MPVRQQCECSVYSGIQPLHVYEGILCTWLGKCNMPGDSKRTHITISTGARYVQN